MRKVCVFVLVQVKVIKVSGVIIENMMKVVMDHIDTHIQKKTHVMTSKQNRSMKSTYTYNRL